MISINRCKEIIGVEMTDSEIIKLRDSLYAMVESVLDNYFEKFDNVTICKKQLYTAESPQLSKVLKDTD